MKFQESSCPAGGLLTGAIKDKNSTVRLTNFQTATHWTSKLEPLVSVRTGETIKGFPAAWRDIYTLTGTLPLYCNVSFSVVLTLACCRQSGPPDSVRARYHDGRCWAGGQT